MLLQIREIKNNGRLIMLMAQALRLCPPRMKNSINNFSIMKGGGRWELTKLYYAVGRALRTCSTAFNNGYRI
ncbi:MAG: hypothetical protein ACUZ8N_08215 [Candidatus Scalindua sp.]